MLPQGQKGRSKVESAGRVFVCVVSPGQEGTTSRLPRGSVLVNCTDTGVTGTGRHRSAARVCVRAANAAQFYAERLAGGGDVIVGYADTGARNVLHYIVQNGGRLGPCNYFPPIYFACMSTRGFREPAQRCNGTCVPEVGDLKTSFQVCLLLHSAKRAR